MKGKTWVEYLNKGLEDGSWPLVVLAWMAFMLGIGVVIGLASTLFLLGFWPFLKLGQWLIG